MEVSKNFREFEAYIKELQARILRECETLEQTPFTRLEWNFKDQGEPSVADKLGGGCSLLVELGHFFEKAGINVSSVGGVLSEEVATLLKVSVQAYAATGLSLVFHPHSPMVPSVHFNIRLFELANGTYWFGGGTDLTPYAPFVADFKYFHNRLREAVEIVYPNRYGEFKQACDEYFYLPHRKEMRGVGGVFFDHLKTDRMGEYKLVRALGEEFQSSWFPIAHDRKEVHYDQVHKLFQQFRHGRYVEFNLLYDRGTVFGLKTGGRVESILMSLPFHVVFTSALSAEAKELAQSMAPYYQAREWD